MILQNKMLVGASLAAIVVLASIGAWQLARMHGSESGGKRHAVLYRLPQKDGNADVAVTIKWTNGDKPGGETWYALRRLRPGEGEGDRTTQESVLEGHDIHWDGLNGYGGYRVSLDTTSERWICQIHSYWATAGSVEQRLDKRFPIVPFETKVFRDGDLDVEIVYEVGSRAAAMSPTSPDHEGAQDRH